MQNIDELSAKECQSLMKLTLNIKKHDKVTVSELASKMGMIVNNPKFYKIMAFLKSNEALIELESVGASKYFQIKYQKVVNLVLQHDSIDLAIQFLGGPGHYFIV